MSGIRRLTMCSEWFDFKIGMRLNTTWTSIGWASVLKIALCAISLAPWAWTVSWAVRIKRALKKLNPKFEILLCQIQLDNFRFDKTIDIPISYLSVINVKLSPSYELIVNLGLLKAVLLKLLNPVEEDSTFINWLLSINFKKKYLKKKNISKNKSKYF